MIYRLIDLPSNLIGFKAQWHFTEKDVTEVMIPSVKEQLIKSPQLNCLIVLNNSVQRFQVNALEGLKHLIHGKPCCHRMALVSGARINRVFFNVLSAMLTIELKTFSHEELEQAIHWAANGT